MSSGYLYGEPEPKSPCPYCGTMCEADFCDIGVGMQQVGPYHCEQCHASEASPHDNHSERSDYDRSTGWYLPDSPPGSTANVDSDGNHISWQEADTAYRDSRGVAPRYGRNGELL